MRIVRTQFRNLKSYGNKLQQVDFNDKDRLILLTGTNGNGKSSILESISLSLYGIVNSKSDKKIPLKDLPNRMNKNLYSSTEFYNNSNDYIQMKRWISPNKFEIFVNDDNYTDKFKLMSQNERMNLIGANYNTFKSFISLDLNTFSDFISLKEDTKRNLVNKLFDLEEIETYYLTTLELINQNKSTIQQIITEISSYDIELNRLKKLIKESSKNISNISKDEIKEQFLSIQKVYKEKKQELNDVNKKISDFSIKIQEAKNESDFYELNNNKKRHDLNDIKSKIKIYEGGTCPYCSSDLNSNDHKSLLSELTIKRDNLLKEIELNTNKSLIYKDELKSISSQKTQLEDSISYLTNDYAEYKSKLTILKNQYENYDDTNDNIIKELKQEGSKILKEKKEKQELILKLKDENVSLNKLKDILGDNGVRNDIISSLIIPINARLKDFLQFIKFPYKFELNDEFNGILVDKGEIINHETLSNGESKILNICIALSYIDMILKTNDINILFMDEVFSSISIDNIDIIIKLLRKFSIDNEVSLILVHHGLEQLDSKLFDKIITVDKNLFSDVKIN